MKQRQDDIRNVLYGTGPQVSEWSAFIQSEDYHNIIYEFIYSILMQQITTGRQKSIFLVLKYSILLFLFFKFSFMFQIIGKFWWLPKSCLEPNLISVFNCCLTPVPDCPIDTSNQQQISIPSSPLNSHLHELWILVIRI